MLAHENRLLLASDFRSTMKQGRKVGSDHLVIYLKKNDTIHQARFGFIVAKTVGGAVERNLVKRRLRAISRESLQTLEIKADVVIRVLSGAAEIGWVKLREEFESNFQTAIKKMTYL